MPPTTCSPSSPWSAHRAVACSFAHVENAVTVAAIRCSASCCGVGSIVATVGARGGVGATTGALADVVPVDERNATNAIAAHTHTIAPAIAPMRTTLRFAGSSIDTTDADNVVIDGGAITWLDR